MVGKLLPASPTGYSQADQASLRRAIQEELGKTLKTDQKIYPVGLYLKDSTTNVFIELTATSGRLYINGNPLGFGGAQFPIEASGTSADWTAALNAAAALASAAGGGVVTAYGHEVYEFSTEPANMPAGVYVAGIPNFTRFKLPNANCRLLEWTGSISSTYTLSGNVAINADVLPIATSISGISAGSILVITKNTGLSLGVPTQLVRVKSVASLNVTLEARLKFAIQTSDTYTIKVLTPVAGGGAYGIIFDGSANVSTTQCVGIYALYCEGMYFDAIGGENCSGSAPTSGGESAVMLLNTCFDTRGLNDLWAYKSGTLDTCDIQFTAMGPTEYGRIHSEMATGFATGWYNCVDQQVNTIHSINPAFRAGKFQCVLGGSLHSGVCDNAGYTGIAFTEATVMDVGQIFYSSVPDVAGDPSFWTNNTGVKLTVQSLRFGGVTNPSGDIHTGSTDDVTIERVSTEGSFTPTYGGTSGSVANTASRRIRDVNGALLLRDTVTGTNYTLTVASGALTLV